MYPLLPSLLPSLLPCDIVIWLYERLPEGALLKSGLLITPYPPPSPLRDIRLLSNSTPFDEVIAALEAHCTARDLSPQTTMVWLSSLW